MTYVFLAVDPTSPWTLVPGLYAVASTIAFVLYGKDKWAAMKQRPRIPESTLHVLEFLGGWPGSLIAQRTFRHKIAKRSYQVVFWTIVVLHVAFWVLLANYVVRI